MAVDRSYYNPTPAQRVELRLAASIMKQHLAQLRREREAVQQFERIGFEPEAARELAKLYAEEGKP